MDLDRDDRVRRRLLLGGRLRSWEVGCLGVDRAREQAEQKEREEMARCDGTTGREADHDPPLDVGRAGVSMSTPFAPAGSSR